MTDPILIAILGLVGTIIVAFLSGAGGIYLTLLRNKNANAGNNSHLQDHVTGALGMLLDEFRKEHEADRVQLTHDRDKIRQLTNEIQNLRNQVETLVTHVAQLETTLRGHGLDVPPRPTKS